METPDLTSFVDDGDELNLGNGSTLKLSVEPDEYESGVDLINGCDCYGQVVYAGHTSHGARPGDFTGAAQKVHLSNGEVYWWEPYREGHKVYDTRDDRQLVRDILIYGPFCITVTWYDDLVDRRGITHRVKVDSESVGGCEPFPTADVVSDFTFDLVEQLLERNTGQSE